MRDALTQAIHHATYRRTFGELLIEHPLMQNVLADLALESEAATLLCIRVARAIDDATHDPQAVPLKRIGTAMAKYYICKRAPAVVGEALRMPGRQRVRRGIDHAATLSRGASELDLGRIRVTSMHSTCYALFVSNPSRWPLGATRSHPRAASRASPRGCETRARPRRRGSIRGAGAEFRASAWPCCGKRR